MARYFIRNNIAINSFKETPNIEKYVHFINYVSNSLTSVPLNLFERIGHVYTSAFFAWYMVNFFGVKQDVFVPINFGEEQTVYKDGKEVTFVFVKSTSVEPNFMILFKGDSGDELFAGSCTFSESMLDNEVLRPYTTSQRLRKLYFDGSHIDCQSVPPLSTVLRSVISTIRANRRQVVYISANRLGNELVLRTIARALNKKVHVSPEKFLTLDKLGLSDCFTTDQSSTYIRAIDYSQISVRKQIRRNKMVGPSKAIVLSLKVFLTERNHLDELAKANILVFPVTSLPTPSTLPTIRRIMADELVLANSLVTSLSPPPSSNSPPSPTPIRRKIYQKCRLNLMAAVEINKISPRYHYDWRDPVEK